MKKTSCNFSPKSSKKSFLLLEVVIAITILMIGTLGGFEMYNVMSKKTHALHAMTQKLLYSEQAVCRLFEQLYTQKIPFEDIVENGSFPCDLDTTWKALFQFYPVENKDDEDMPKNTAIREVRITLINNENDEKNITLPYSFPLCIKKE